MSLYCYGAIRLSAGVAEPYSFPEHSLVSRSVDPDDAKEIDSIVQIGTGGIYFSVCDDSKAVDATALWNEAREHVPQDATGSRLGKIVHSLLFDSRISLGAIAFVDGGIETVLKGSRAECWQWYLERIPKPWDLIDNPVLIWNN